MIHLVVPVVVELQQYDACGNRENREKRVIPAKELFVNQVKNNPGAAPNEDNANDDVETADKPFYKS